MADPQRLEAAAEAAETQGDWAQAEHHWRTLVKQSPHHGSGWHRLGKAIAQQQHWDEALAYQQKSCQLHPQLGWNWFAAGEALEQLGRGESAARQYRQAGWRLPEETWIEDVARRAEQRAWLGGEDLREGLGSKAYRHWCERLEPPLPKPAQPLQDNWWVQEAPGLWARWDGNHQVVERQQGLWPRGEGWLLQLAADARLRREALLAMEEAIGRAETLPALVYPDEDRLDHQGRRHDPWFKPGWVPESFWSSPWLEACSVWRLSWLQTERVPPPPVGAAAKVFGWQLNALTHQPQVLAIPRVLVHRTGNRRQASAELNATAAQLEQHLRAQGEAVQVRPHGPEGQFQIQWALPASPPAVQVVIPTKDQPKLLGQCLESLERTCSQYAGMQEVQISVVDHASQEPETAALLQHWRRRLGNRFSVVRMGGPFNWSRLNNRAIRQGRTPLVLLLNNDVEALQAGWLEAMAAQAMRPAIGAVGAVLLYPNRTIQHAGVQLGFGRMRNSAEHAYRGLPATTSVHRHRAQLLTGWPAVTGACLMVQRAHWSAVRGLDERLPVEFNDVAFCLRLMERGLRNVVEPAAQLIHHECQSREPVNSPTAEAALERVNRLFPQLMQSSTPWWPAAVGAGHTDGRPHELSGYA